MGISKLREKQHRLQQRRGRSWVEDHHTAGISLGSHKHPVGNVCMCGSVHTCPCVCSACVSMVEGNKE